MLGNVVIAIITLVLGGYIGLVTARYVKFTALRDEALRIVRGIEYGCEGDKPVRKIKGYDPNRFTLIGSDLFTAKHKNAGHCILDLHRSLSDIVHKAEHSGAPISEVSEIDLDAQKKIRKVAPNIRALLSPIPRL